MIESVDNNTADRIGRRGERKFEDLCELAGLAVSRLEPDMTGKDRLVEFPLVEPVGDLTYDTRPAPRSCYVQVKTLLKRNNRFAMRLSAAERLARDPKPTFVCVLRIDSRNEFVDIHLIHIDAQVLATILKRLRAEAARGSKDLNRKRITLAISAGRKVEVAHDALRLALVKDIGDDMHAYSRRKEEQLKELGYDTHRILLKIEFSPLRPDQIVDGFLGLHELPVTKLASFERRFDIAIPSGPHGHGEPESQTIRVMPHPLDRCVIRFQSADDSEVATVEGDLYGPPALGLPPEFLKLLVRSDILDVSFCPDHVDVKTNAGFADAKRHPLKVWLETCRVLKFLAQGGCEVTFHMKSLNRDFRPPGLSKPDRSIDTRWIIGAIDILGAALELRHMANADDVPVALSDLFCEEKNIVRRRTLGARAH